MAVKPISADSRMGRLLLALRRGPHEPHDLFEQFGSRFSRELPQLIRSGLVEQVDGSYRLTPAGRAACPFRNPKAATAAAPEIFTMPKGETQVTRQQVLAFILAGGAAGATRKQLIDKFAGRATEQAVDMHLGALNRAQPPVVFKPKPGLLVGIAHKPGDAPEISPKTASTATDEWIPEPLATDPPAASDMHGVPLVVDHHEAADLPALSLAAQMAQIGGRLPAIVEDIRLSDPDTVEFAIYSSGGLDIFSEDCAITLDRAVLGKLRSFLGLFQGEAA